MNLHKQLLARNSCYVAGRMMHPQGIVVHSTGANNPYLNRYIAPDDGLLGANKYNNHWNKPADEFRRDCQLEPACVHAFIGKLADGSIATYQTLPWEYKCWGCGSGWRGSYNNSHIQFEICEANLQDADYFDRVYREAVEFCAYLCDMYKIPVENIVCHKEAADAGYAYPHADIMHWWPLHGKNMSTFRADVQRCMDTGHFEPEMSYEDFRLLMEVYLAEVAQLPGADWSAPHREWAIDNDIAQGDGQSMKWKSNTSREEMVTFLQRLFDILVEPHPAVEVTPVTPTVRHINDDGLAMIKFYEGCSLTACKALPTEEHWSIGYGHYGADVTPGMTITQAQADALLRKDMELFERYVNDPKYVPFTDELNDNQFSALIVFAYNCGIGSLKQLCNGRGIDEITQYWSAYAYSGGNYIEALARRREAEIELYQREDEEMSYEKFKEYMDRYNAELAAQEPSAWSEPQRIWAESNGIITGDGSGNKQYKAFCTREQMVTFLERLYRLVMEQK